MNQDKLSQIKNKSKKKDNLGVIKKNFKKQQPKKLDLWFNDKIANDAQVLDAIENNQCSAKGLIKSNSFKGITKSVAIDCEFVGVGWEGKDNMLARVSIVNENGHVLLDSYVKPMEKVVDYRTHVSGILPQHLRSADAVDFKTVCEKAAAIMKDRIIVGHSISHDLKALYLDHPRRLIRDTSRYKPFRQESNGRTPGLKLLTNKLLGVAIQANEHDSVIDARATMRLYQHVKNQWEKMLVTKQVKEEKPKIGWKVKHEKVVARKAAALERAKLKK